MIDLRPVFFVVGLMVTALGLMMFVPMIVDFHHDDGSWQTFGISGILTTMMGAVMATSAYTPQPNLGARGAFLLTVLSWVALSFFAAIPFLMNPMQLSFTDAMFEATSGITTTGATVLTGLDDLDKGILLWRAILQWIGGVGIVVTAMAVLPMLKVGGMQLFRLESSDMGEKILPRAASIAKAIGLIYLILTIACAIGYMMVGMSSFNAVAHAMTTVSTGGYSTSDLSMGGYMDGGADIVGVAFMILGSLPFAAYLLMGRGDFSAPFKDPQIRAFIGLLLFLTAIVTLGLLATSGLENARALRLAVFNTVSIVMGTGYATADYQIWGTFAVGLFFVFMFVGGCAGSTTCSVKIFRYQVAFEALKSYLFRMPKQHAIAPMRYGGRPLPEQIVFSVMSFFFLFFATFAVTAILLSLIGLDPITAWSGAASAVANVGPGLGDIIGPAGTYQTLPNSAKWVLLTAMIIGRLEIVTALVIMMPGFWKG